MNWPYWKRYLSALMEHLAGESGLSVLRISFPRLVNSSISLVDSEFPTSGIPSVTRPIRVHRLIRT
jgi:hypothetical protein